MLKRFKNSSSLNPLYLLVNTSFNAFFLQGATALRGNLLWAPPRPQLVLTVQYKPKNRKEYLHYFKYKKCANKYYELKCIIIFSSLIKKLN